MNRMKKWFNDEVILYKKIGNDDYGDNIIYGEGNKVKCKIEGYQRIRKGSQDRDYTSSSYTQEVINRLRVFMGGNTNITIGDKIYYENNYLDKDEFIVVDIIVDKNHKGKIVLKEVFLL